MADARFLVAGFLKRKFNNVRQRLNTERFHFMPLNLEAFKLSLQTATDSLEDVDAIYNGLLTHLKTKHGKNLLPVSAIPTLKKDALKGSPSLVYQGTKDNIVGVIYQGYNSAYESAFRGYLNSVINKTINTPFGAVTTKESPADLISDTRYENTKYKKGFDVGHMFAGKDSEYGDTPLSYKLRILQQAINNLSNNKLVLASRSGIPEDSNKQQVLSNISNKINQALEDLETRSNIGIEVSAKLSKTITNNLAKVGAVIVLPQSRIENQLDYGVLIEAEIERELSEILKTVKFSPNLIEEMHTRIVAPLTKFKNKDINLTLNIPVFKVKSPVKTKVATSKSKSAVVPITVPSIKVLPVEYNLTSLQRLLDAQLQDVVSANMGSGNERQILNYRTGRLAASAKVERLTMSKAGMITAFYTYMKNPYGTFSEGGRQQYPRSRDPKLLISKSIKEIAANSVANRLRAVAL